MSKSLSSMLARVFVLMRPFEGLPNVSDFEIVEENIREELNDGGNHQANQVYAFKTFKIMLFGSQNYAF
jgi:hypothetical protein